MLTDKQLTRLALSVTPIDCDSSCVEKLAWTEPGVLFVRYCGSFTLYAYLDCPYQALSGLLRAESIGYRMYGIRRFHRFRQLKLPDNWE